MMNENRDRRHARVKPARASSSLRDRHPLRPAASTPLWLQLKHALRDLMASDLEPGDRIPSEAELCAAYGLSRVTVRQAITALVDEGVLHRQHGRGTFVLPARVTEPLADAEHFLESSFDTAASADLRIFSAETVPASDWLAERFDLRPGDPVHKFRKVLLHEGRPVAFRTSFVPRRLCPTLLEVDLLRPLHAIYEDVYGLKPEAADEAIQYIVADEFRAQLLEVPIKHPLMNVERRVYLDTGEPVEFSRAYYRADRFELRRHLRRAHRRGSDVSAIRVVAFTNGVEAP